MEWLGHLVSSFMSWHDAQPAIVRLYVDYVIVRSIVMKFVSDETKRWIVEPVWRGCKLLLLKLVVKPLKRTLSRWLATTVSGSAAQLRVSE